MKHVTFPLILALWFGSILSALASTIAIDNFNRTVDETPLASPWVHTTGRSFQLLAADDFVKPTADGTGVEAIYSGPTWPADQYSKAKLTTTGTDVNTGPGVIVRGAMPTRTGYRLYVNHGATNNVEIDKWVGGALIGVLVSITNSWSDGDTWELQVTGTGTTVTLKIFKNGSQVGSDVTDSAADRILSGSAGIAYSSTATGSQIDDWEGGDFVSAGGSRRRLTVFGVGP